MLGLYYTADVLSVQDYYGYGASMEGRSWSRKRGRFGFNGQEKDNEIAGEASSYTATFWQYDPRLGRRWNLDPKPFSGVSRYSTFMGNPIMFRDPFGDIIDVEGTKKFVKKTNEALDRMRETKEGRALYDELHNDEHVYTIREYGKSVVKTNADSDLPSDWKVGDIGFNRKESNGFDNGEGGWLILGHELNHSRQVKRGTISDKKWQTPDKTFSYGMGAVDSDNGETRIVPTLEIDEIEAVHSENKMRAEAEIELRTHYTIIGVNYGDGVLSIPIQRLLDKNSASVYYLRATEVSIPGHSSDDEPDVDDLKVKIPARFKY